MESVHQTVVYPDGTIVDHQKCADVLKLYWQLNKAEKCKVNQLLHRKDLEAGFNNWLDKQSNHA